ncbi:MAG: SpoIIE family protein phosphatase [Clostridiaceae bacterium]|nr:SpoIIE family protein phosphatase [Clostridiaceae bacterium]
MRNIYPDTLDRSEVQVGKALDDLQIYSITDGMGGSGVGDIAGRLVQELLIKSVSEINLEDPEDFDFANFSENYLKAITQHLKERLARYKNKRVGCSLAFILIFGAEAYTFSIGTNRIYLIRDNRIYRITQDHRQSNSKEPSIYLGNFTNSSQLKPKNLNKIRLQTNDNILLLTDGIYHNFSDQEILEKIQQSDSFIQSMRLFEKELDTKHIADDHTLLALKIEETSDNSQVDNDPSNFVISQMVEQSVLEGNDQLETDAPLWTDNRFDYSLDQDEYVGEYIEESSGRTKFVQGLKIFGTSYGIGLLIGLLLFLIFRVFVVGF